MAPLFPVESNGTVFHSGVEAEAMAEEARGDHGTKEGGADVGADLGADSEPDAEMLVLEGVEVVGAGQR